MKLYSLLYIGGVVNHPLALFAFLLPTISDCVSLILDCFDNFQMPFRLCACNFHKSEESASELRRKLLNLIIMSLQYTNAACFASKFPNPIYLSISMAPEISLYIIIYFI